MNYDLIAIVAAFNAGIAVGSAAIYSGYEQAPSAQTNIIVALVVTGIISAIFYVIDKLNRDFPRWKIHK